MWFYFYDVLQQARLILGDRVRAGRLPQAGRGGEGFQVVEARKRLYQDYRAGYTRSHDCQAHQNVHLEPVHFIVC